MLKQLLCVLSLFWMLKFSHAEDSSTVISGTTMGTYYRVVLPQRVQSPETLKRDIEDCLTEMNRQMSTWDYESEISRFNRSASTDWFEVSAEFASVVAEAKRIHEASQGAFDPTVEPLIRLWGFGDQREQTVPDPADVAEALAVTGMKHVDVRAEPPAIRKKVPGLQLNLSAIAKGYAVDAVAELLESSGEASYVVDIGGENRAGATKPSGDPWKLGIESPLGGLQRVLAVTGRSVATSGNYRNFFSLDGVTYSHAIDPATGRPVADPPASVTVVADSCMAADAWATAMMVLRTEKGVALADNLSLAVMFQDVDSDAGQVTETPSNQFHERYTALSEEEGSQKKSGSSAPWFPFVAAAVLFCIAVAGMAVGTILQQKSLKGSCGGLASMPGSDGKSICELCTIPKDECTNAELRAQLQAAQATDEDVS